MSEWLVVYSLECRADLCASVGNQIISKTSSIENQQRQPENPFSVFIVAPHSLIQRWLVLLYYLYYLRLAALYKT